LKLSSGLPGPLKLTSSLKGKVISVIVTASRTGYTTAAVSLREAAKIA
jgi:hypothetical protein